MVRSAWIVRALTIGMFLACASHALASESPTGRSVTEAGSIAGGGITLAAIHLTTVAIGAGVYVGTWETGPSLALLVMSSVICLVDTPLLLVADKKARELLGHEGIDVLNGITMAFYAISVAYIPVHAGGGLAYWDNERALYGITITGGLLYLITRTLSLVVGFRALRNVARAKRKLDLGPSVSHVPGGMAAGLGGTF